MENPSSKGDCYRRARVNEYQWENGPHSIGKENWGDWESMVLVKNNKTLVLVAHFFNRLGHEVVWIGIYNLGLGQEKLDARGLKKGGWILPFCVPDQRRGQIPCLCPMDALILQGTDPPIQTKVREWRSPSPPWRITHIFLTSLSGAEALIVD